MQSRKEETSLHLLFHIKHFWSMSFLTSEQTMTKLIISCEAFQNDQPQFRIQWFQNTVSQAPSKF